MSDASSPEGAASVSALKRVPAGALRHAGAGPYSPVIEIKADRLVVLSGQVANDPDGRIVGSSIEEQSQTTLDNCRRQLACAGCDMSDVFKVNVYLADLSDWARFNAVYERNMPAPLPARTAVQAVLLPGFNVEIEMWAVKRDD
jgi:2-iminobutanoate/2-iminopropanoate deaminase